MRGRSRAIWIAIIMLAGCGDRTTTAPPTAQPYAGLTVRIGGAPETLVTTLQAQRGEWESRQGAIVSLVTGADAQSDIIAFRGDTLGDLMANGKLAHLPKDLVRPPIPLDSGLEAVNAAASAADDRLKWNDLLKGYQDHVSRYGEGLRGLPVGGSVLVLVYRRDLFEKPEHRDRIQELGLKPEPPRTYEQLDTLVKIAHGRDWDGDHEPDFGIAVALGDDPEGMADAVYLARAAAVALHPDQFEFLFDDETMEPWIARPPFVVALEDLILWKTHGPPGAEKFNADAARAAFRAGKTAFLIDRAEMASNWTDAKKPIAVGVAPLPGSFRVFEPFRKDWQTLERPNRPTLLPFGGGWLVGLSGSSQGREQAAAIDFMKDLAGPETAARLAANRDFPLLPLRAELLAAVGPDPRNAPGVESRSWGRAVSESLNAARLVPSLRIPDTAGYLADLAKTRQAALTGKLAAEDALKQTESDWSARTKRLGAARQLWHYQMSLNRTPTNPEPPSDGK